MVARAAASLERVAGALEAAPVADFLGRPEGVIAATAAWLVRWQWHGAGLQFTAEGTVPDEVQRRLAAASKQPSTPLEWLAWRRTAEFDEREHASLDASGSTDDPAVREAFVDACRDRDVLDVAALATLLGPGDATAEYDGSAWVVTVTAAAPWLGEARTELVIGGVSPEGVVRVASAPDASLCAGIDPDDRSWFVRTGGLALWWPSAGATLELVAGPQRWRIDDPAAERLGRAMFGDERAGR